MRFLILFLLTWSCAAQGLRDPLFISSSGVSAGPAWSGSGGGGGGEAAPTSDYTNSIIAWFKADESTGATTAIDSVNGFNLPITTGSLISSNGLLGRSWDMNQTQWRRTTGTNFGFVGCNFTARFWIKLATGPTDDQFPFGNNSYDIAVSSNRKLTWEVLTVASIVTVQSAAVPLDENWHRVVCWLSISNQIGIILDTNAPVIASFPESLIDRGDDYFQLGNTSPDHILIDELAFWRNYCLTNSTDLDYDWHGGAGRTYPP